MAWGMLHVLVPGPFGIWMLEVLPDAFSDSAKSKLRTSLSCGIKQMIAGPAKLVPNKGLGGSHVVSKCCKGTAERIDSTEAWRGKSHG